MLQLVGVALTYCANVYILYILHLVTQSHPVHILGTNSVSLRLYVHGQIGRMCFTICSNKPCTLTNMSLQARSKRSASSAPAAFHSSNYRMPVMLSSVAEVGMISGGNPAAEVFLQHVSPLKDAMSTDTVFGGTQQSSAHTRSKSVIKAYRIHIYIQHTVTASGFYRIDSSIQLIMLCGNHVDY